MDGNEKMKQQVPQGGDQHDAAAAARPKTGLFIALGWILAIASLIIFPFFIFGLAGVIMGILATKGGSKGGVAVIAANIILMGIGLISGSVIWNYLTRLFGM